MSWWEFITVYKLFMLVCVNGEYKSRIVKSSHALFRFFTLIYTRPSVLSCLLGDASALRIVIKFRIPNYVCSGQNRVRSKAGEYT
jgi:hypothetical protein